MFQKTRTKTYSQSDTNLLAHVVHADSCDYIFPWRAMVEADELRRENYTTKEAERKRGEHSFPGTYNEFQALVSLWFRCVFKSWSGPKSRLPPVLPV